tara:strand:- start:17749 stop:18012 length:264 start_codon:yes stop_codon:yes gene_type:complete
MEDKKPVMGHNPLGYRPLAEAKFSFIPQTDSGSGAGEGEELKSSPSKKTVSYYLEEDLIDEIKKRAKENQDSYSHFVNQTLKKAIKE